MVFHVTLARVAAGGAGARRVSSAR
jgi:hypothetical protein